MPVMTKPKPEPKRAARVEMTTRGVRMTIAYAAWIDKLAASERMGVATLIDRAVADYAKNIGFEPPPERVP
jgi:hypothetical protein